MIPKNFLILLAITIPFCLSAQEISDDRPIIGNTYFHARSQASNSARDMVGILHHINRPCTCDINGTLAITPAISQSYDGNELGKFFFFNGTSVMNFGNVEGAGVSVFGENFLLNDNFNGAVVADPRVKNYLADVALFLGLDNITRGLYFRVHAPVVNTNWSMDLSETAISMGSDIPAERLGNPVATPAPFNDIISAWNGQATFFDVQEPLKFGRIDGPRKKTLVADVETVLGYNFILTECSHFGLNLRAIFPTGNAPTGKFMFEPIVGNGHHYEFGGGIGAHKEIWNEGEHQCLEVWFFAHLYHMFKTKQHRTFDLKENGRGSRYLMLKRFNGDTNTYEGEIVRGPNALTLEVESSNAFHADVSLMLDYYNCGYTFDVGYNLWGRTHDQITFLEEIPNRTYGIAGLSGTGANANRTASMTTIDGENAADLDGVSSADNIYLSTLDLDIDSAEHPGAFSHGIFMHFGYTWENCHWWPFLGIGGELEFSGRNNRALRMWHLWAKGGISFF